jgi:hypothetical protein
LTTKISYDIFSPMALYEGGKGRALDQFIDVIGKNKPTRRPMHATGREARLGGGVSLGSSEGQRPVLSEIAHIGLGAEDGLTMLRGLKKG